MAGIPVWYDAVNLPPGASFVQGLHESIVKSRSAIILLSRDSVASGWVEQERDEALNQHTMTRKFHVIPLRLDDVKPPDFISNFSNIEIGETELGSAAAAQILQGLCQSPHLVPDPAYGKHTYFSRDGKPRTSLAGTVSEALSSAGLRLVGDAEDRGEYDLGRIGGIMDGCGAYAAALPYRPSGLETTSRATARTSTSRLAPHWPRAYPSRCCVRGRQAAPPSCSATSRCTTTRPTPS